MDKSAYPTLENDISIHIIEYTKTLLEEALLKEVREWALQEENVWFNFEEWQDAWQNDKPFSFDKMPRLMVSYDMGWQKRSSGRRYDSHSGHAATVGACTRKPIGLDILSKLCRVCSRHTGDGEAAPHDCSKNFDRNDSSGSMEPQALVSIAHQLLDDYYVVLETIIADDDSSVRAQMKWSNPDWMIHHNLTRLPKIWSEAKQECVTRAHGGKLRYPYPEPTFLADPQHRTKLFGKKLFGMESKTNENNNGVNKVDCFTLKKNFGYMSKQMRTAPRSEWLDAGVAALEHYFENHNHCGDWCKRRSMSETELEVDRKDSGKYYRCKQRDSKVYAALKGIIAPFITLERLQEIAHGHDTQINESLNNTISWLAPKNKTFCGSRSLPGRVHLAIGIQIAGYERFMFGLLERLGISVTPGVRKHVKAIGRRKERHSQLHKTKEYKRKRQDVTRKKVKAHIQDAENKRRKNGFYAPGEGFNTCLPVLDPNVCPHCLKKGHKTTVSKQCNMNTLKVKQRAEEELRRRQEAITERYNELNNN